MRHENEKKLIQGFMNKSMARFLAINSLLIMFNHSILTKIILNFDSSYVRVLFMHPLTLHHTSSWPQGTPTRYT